MTTLPTGQPLLGRHVALTLFSDADVAGMSALLDDPVIYAHGYVNHHRPRSPEASEAVVRDRFSTSAGPPDGQGGGRTTYAVRLVSDSYLGSADTLVGTSTLMEAHLVNETIHLGSTLYGSRWWGTVVNAEAKLLLLSHCFDDCGYGRVKIQTDLLNTRSQAAIAKLGAVQEGVLRREQKREDGSFRDTVVFSIIRDEWPAVRAGLTARVAG